MSPVHDLTLRSLLAKKTQLPTSVLPCKLRFLKYPHAPRETTTSILFVLDQYQTWDSTAQTALDALHINLGYKAFIEVIKSLQSIDVAMGFFHWASQQQGFKHNTKTYSAIARIVGKTGDLKLMHSLLQQMQKEGCPVTPYFFADIMMVYGHLGKVKQAYLVFKEMKNAGLSPNQFVNNCLISILLKNGYLEGAKKVLNMMRSDDECPPDRVTFNMLIDKCGKSGNIVKAQQYCVEMRQRGLWPNEKSYASLFGSLYRKEKFEKASELFDAIKRKRKLVNRVTYTELIKGLGQAGETEKALEMFRKMEDTGCVMDVVVYNIMMDVLVKRQLVTEAWKLFVSMQGKQCFPTVVTYNIMISGFCMAKRVDEALRWYDRMKEEGVNPDCHTHSIIVGGLCKGRQIDAAYKFLMERQSAYVPKVEAPRGNEGECLEQGTVMGVAVHNVMLNAFVKAGRLETACAHLKVMEEHGCMLDVFSYSIIIHGLGNAGRAKDASAMYTKMKESGICPNLVTFNTMIDILGKAGMIFEVHEIVEEMKSLGLRPDIISYTSLLPIAGKDSKGLRRQNPAALKLRFDHVLGIPNVKE